MCLGAARRLWRMTASAWGCDRERRTAPDGMRRGAGARARKTAGILQGSERKGFDDVEEAQAVPVPL